MERREKTMGFRRFEVLAVVFIVVVASRPPPPFVIMEGRGSEGVCVWGGVGWVGGGKEFFFSLEETKKRKKNTLSVFLKKREKRKKERNKQKQKKRFFSQWRSEAEKRRCCISCRGRVGMSPNPPLTESPEPSSPVVVTERKREGLVFRVVSERGWGKRRRERESSRKEKKVFFPFLARVPNSPPPERPEVLLHDSVLRRQGQAERFSM